MPYLLDACSLCLVLSVHETGNRKMQDGDDMASRRTLKATKVSVDVSGGLVVPYHVQNPFKLTFHSKAARQYLGGRGRGWV